MKKAHKILAEETVQADSRGRIGLGPKHALYIKRIDAQGNIVLIPSRPVPTTQVENLILLNRTEMENLVSHFESPKPRNAAFEKAHAKFKEKYK